MNTFTCGIGTSYWRIGRAGRCLIDGAIRLRIIIPAEDVLVGWADVSCVGLLMDRIGFPAKWDERYDFVVVSDTATKELP